MRETEIETPPRALINKMFISQNYSEEMKDDYSMKWVKKAFFRKNRVIFYLKMNDSQWNNWIFGVINVNNINSDASQKNFWTAICI